MTFDFANLSHLLLAALPETVLAAWSLLVLLVAAWRHHTPADARLAAWLTVTAFAVTEAAVLFLWRRGFEVVGIEHMLAVDSFRFAASTVFLVAGVFTVLLSIDYVERSRMVVAEYYLMLIFAVLGMMFLAAAEDLIVLFIGLELLSISAYVLAALNRRSRTAAEAGFKYFLLGAFASGFLLYGIALIYGATATTNLTIIAFQITSLELGSNVMLLVGMVLLLIGFAFKVSAVPFHMWAPDVYDGAPAPISAFMAAAVKAAGFAALFRVAIEAFGTLLPWHDMIWGLAVATMVVGNLVALAQRSLKRMLAYSSIAHAGYLLVAVVPGSEASASALLFYLVAYTLMTVAAFAVLIGKGQENDREVLIDDLAGLWRTRPWYALAMTVAMLSLLGFPGTAGFIGKWHILQAAVASGEVALSTVLVLSSVVSAGYYLPVIMAMYMQKERAADAHAHVGLAPSGRLVLALTTVGTLYLGVLPARALDIAADGGQTVAESTTAGFAQESGPSR